MVIIDIVVTIIDNRILSIIVTTELHTPKCCTLRTWAVVRALEDTGFGGGRGEIIGGNQMCTMRNEK